jgi:5'-deoxynucleotidase YfbR-like HD superfamily hydrolase
MHDGHESYTGDIPYPMIVAVQCICMEQDMHADPIAIIKKRVQRAIERKWSLRNDSWTYAAIKEADARMLQTERQQILGPPPQPWSLPDSVPPYDLAIEGWSPEQAELEFRSAFIDLATKRGIRLIGELSQ